MDFATSRTSNSLTKQLGMETESFSKFAEGSLVQKSDILRTYG